MFAYFLLMIIFIILMSVFVNNKAVKNEISWQEYFFIIVASVMLVNFLYPVLLLVFKSVF